MRSLLQLFTLSFCFLACSKAVGQGMPEPADLHPDTYLALLKGKRVALVVNQSSSVNDSLLPEFLLGRGIAVRKIFVPEHGFRGREDAGAHIGNTTDSLTHLLILSLYGKHKKPDSTDLADVDMLVYDLQDVGVRFYTYISTLQYCMEACAAWHKNMLVLDRPDPNGFYVDGPVLEEAYKSFVGMQPVPIVYGMTCGEYARMLEGEGWFAGARGLDLIVTKCVHYTHRSLYELPVAPSPNLRTAAAILAYPSLCLFEGTPISVGRGTELPFQQYGSPELVGAFTYTFTPRSMVGATQPPYKDIVCYGERLGAKAVEGLRATGNGMTLEWLIKAYLAYPEKAHFFTGFFRSLSGTATLEAAIKNGASEQQIKKSWQAGIARFKKIRRKYLLYADFE